MCSAIWLYNCVSQTASDKKARGGFPNNVQRHLAAQLRFSDSVFLPPEDEESIVAVRSEFLIVGASIAAHTVHHLLAKLHRRRKGLWIMAKDEAKVDMKQFALAQKHNRQRTTNQILLPSSLRDAL